LEGVLAFHRVSRTLRTADVAQNLTWERLSALSTVVAREPVSISELSVAERVTSPTMSRTVSALQSRELVRCVGHRRDKRSVLVVSTAKGRSTLQKGLVRSLHLLAESLGRLDNDALRAMAEMIREVRDTKRAGAA
jgi:DNA-binding MarR family transcriptional regulator